MPPSAISPDPASRAGTHLTTTPPDAGAEPGAGTSQVPLPVRAYVATHRDQITDAAQTHRVFGDWEGLRAFVEEVLARGADALELSQGALVLPLVRPSLPGQVVCRSEAMQKLYGQLALLAPQSVVVHLEGETGVGKELAARTIHQGWGRGTFVAVNCAAIPKDLLESELFGHERGAFTGAVQQKAGQLEEAHGGTVFLDEVGELSLDLQAKLLRVLQESEFRRLGSNRVIRLDARIVTASNRNLETMVRRGTFREDLFYRLTFKLKVPPLRERPEDLVALTRHLLQDYARKFARPPLEPSANFLELLAKHPWPGNVRELENVLMHIVLLSPAGQPDLSYVPTGAETSTPGAKGRTFEVIVRDGLVEALRDTGGNVAQAARRLGLNRSTLDAKLRRYGIK